MNSDFSSDNLNVNTEKTKILGSKDMNRVYSEAAAEKSNNSRRITNYDDDYSAALLDALNNTDSKDSVFSGIRKQNYSRYSFDEDENEKVIAAKVNTMMSGGLIFENNTSDTGGASLEIGIDINKNSNHISNAANDFESTMYRPGRNTENLSARPIRESRSERYRRVKRNRRILLFGTIGLIVLIVLITVLVKVI